MIKKMFVNWIRSRFTPPVQVVVEPPPPPIPSPMPAPEAKPSVRPMSAVELLQNEPNLTPAELAERAGVTLSYARSLVRRRQNRAAAPVVWPIAPRTSATIAPRSDSTRTLVIERTAAGVGVPAICEDLGMPKGEVEFILKVDRLKKSLKN